MNRIAHLSLCTLAAAAMMVTACSKKSPDSPATATDATTSGASVTTPGTGGLTPQQIADTLAKSVCKRMPGCNPQGGTESDCVTGLSKDMAGNLSDKARAVNQGQLDGCVAAITKATCEQLATSAPTGCEFLD